jgi:hypothetical protein
MKHLQIIRSMNGDSGQALRADHSVKLCLCLVEIDNNLLKVSFHHEGVGLTLLILLELFKHFPVLGD